MDIRPLPEEVPYILAEHHEIRLIPTPEYPESVEGLSEEVLAELPPKELEELGDPKSDAPKFVYKPLTPRERGRWANKLYGDGITRSERTDYYLDLFDERLLRVENLTIDGEPFDKNKHTDALDLKWQTEVAMIIFSRSKLDEKDAGK
jgi:hypothetical protein